MDGKRKGFLAALIIGLLAGPVLALGATRLLGAAPAAAAPATTAAISSSTTAAPAPPATPGPDLAAACTVEGAELVRREAAGTLSDLQQAALDALRPICAEEGLALAPAFVAKAEVSAAAPAAPAGGASDVASGGEYDDGDEDEYEYEYEYEDDEESEDEHEAGDEDGEDAGDRGSDG